MAEPVAEAIEVLSEEEEDEDGADGTDEEMTEAGEETTEAGEDAVPKRYGYAAEGMEWLRTCDHAKSDLVDIDLVVDGTGEVVCVPDLHRFALAHASTYFRSRLMGAGLQLSTGSRWRETLTQPEVAVAPSLLGSIYTQELPAELEFGLLRLPALLAAFQLSDRWGMRAAGRACALRVADLCARDLLPLQELLSVLVFTLFDAADFRNAARACDAALARRGMGRILDDPSAQLGLLSEQALEHLVNVLPRHKRFHPNDVVLLLAVWADAHKDALDPGTLRGIFRGSVAGDLTRLTPGCLANVLARQPWSPDESELIQAWRQARFWQEQKHTLRGIAVTFQVSQAVRTALQTHQRQPQFTEAQYFGGYWWALRLSIEGTLVTAMLCLDRPPNHILQCLDYTALEEAGVVAHAELRLSGNDMRGRVLKKGDNHGWFVGRCLPATLCTVAAFTDLNEIKLTFTDLR
jgi:hypothetical protein